MRKPPVLSPPTGKVPVLRPARTPRLPDLARLKTENVETASEETPVESVVEAPVESAVAPEAPVVAETPVEPVAAPQEPVVAETRSNRLPRRKSRSSPKLRSNRSSRRKKPPSSKRRSSRSPRRKKRPSSKPRKKSEKTAPTSTRKMKVKKKTKPFPRRRSRSRNPSSKRNNLCATLSTVAILNENRANATPPVATLSRSIRARFVRFLRLWRNKTLECKSSKK